MAFDMRGSLWEQTKKDEKGNVNVFLSGVCNKDIKAGDRIFVFKAKKRVKEGSPHYYLNVGDNRE